MIRVVRSLGVFLLSLLFLSTVPAYPQTSSSSSSSQQTLSAAHAAMEQQRYLEAIRLLQEALEQSPSDWTLKVELGRAFLYNRQDDQAIRLFREVLRDESSNRTAKLELARAQGYHGRYKDSDRLYRELLASDPEDEAAALGLIRNLLHQKRTTEARREIALALTRHPDSKRLREYKQRLDSQETTKQGAARRSNAGAQPALERRPAALQGSFGYFTDSAGNSSWRSTQGFDQQLTRSFATRFRTEERSLWQTGGPKANVLWGTGEMRWHLSRFFSLNAGGGGTRFADQATRALYEGELEFHPARSLWVTGGFSRRPIYPTFQSAQFDLLAEGFHTGLDWYPRWGRINTRWSREHYSDGNRDNRFETEALRWIGDSRFAFGVGYRFNYLAFRQTLLHGYFNPSRYYGHLGLTGGRFRFTNHLRAEYLAGVGAESISAGPYQVAWEIGLRNRAQMHDWELGADYFYYHLAQST